MGATAPQRPRAHILSASRRTLPGAAPAASAIEGQWRTEWRARAPAYFYVTSDGTGPPPDPQPNCQPQPVCEWYNQTVFDARVNGVCQETCRDM